MNFLKQSTASQTRTIGSFVDDTDFKTVENGLTIANTDIKLKKNGATAVNKNSGGATSDVNGMYALTFDATDTNTVGELDVSVLVSGALVVWKTFFVLEEAVFDLFFGAASTGEVVLQGVTHTGATVPTVSTLTGHTAQTGDSFTRIGAAGAGLTNIDLPNQTMDIVGNITGNLSGSAGSVTGAVGSVTGAVGSVTAAVTVGTINTNVITATSIAAAALNGKGDWNIGKTGYSISGTITTLDGLNNFNSATDTVALVTDVATKTGYALSAAGDQSVADLIRPPVNIALADIPFLFVAASDHVTPVTGATGTAVTRSIDGGAFGAGTGTINEVGNGMYSYDASSADMNGAVIIFRFTGTGGTPGAPDDTFLSIRTS